MKITMRKLAARLGCSVAPLYVNFKNGEELKKALYGEIKKVAWEYSTKPYSETGFFNIGIGQILFARDFPQLYRDLLALDDQCFHMGGEEKRAMVDIMAGDPLVSDLSRSQLGELLQTMALMTTGITVSVVTGDDNITIEEVLRLMEDTVQRLLFAFKADFRTEERLNLDLDL